MIQQTINFKMISDNQNSFEEDQTRREIQKAQKKLDEVEVKMNKLRSKKKLQQSKHLETKNVQAPYPDLAKYFSYILEDPILEEESTFNHKRARDQNSISMAKRYESNLLEQSSKENNSISINKKLERQKNNSIDKLQQYYDERNEAIEIKIKQLQRQKQKIIRDQHLLIRNNEDLEDEIRRKKIPEPNSRIIQMKQKISKMIKSIESVEQQNKLIQERKSSIADLIADNLKYHKSNVSQQYQRSQSAHHNRCHY